MTTNQIAYAQLLETQRSNKAKEQETERANKVKEVETERANRAKELETRRSNLASEYNASEKNAASIKSIWGAGGYALRNLGRASSGTRDESKYVTSGEYSPYGVNSAVERSAHPWSVKAPNIYA